VGECLAKAAEVLTLADDVAAEHITLLTEKLKVRALWRVDRRNVMLPKKERGKHSLQHWTFSRTRRICLGKFAPSWDMEFVRFRHFTQYNSHFTCISPEKSREILYSSSVITHQC
jgi:hypothetical protein